MARASLACHDAWSLHHWYSIGWLGEPHLQYWRESHSEPWRQRISSARMFRQLAGEIICASTLFNGSEQRQRTQHINVLELEAVLGIRGFLPCLSHLKDILNNIWTTGDFQWRAATVISIPKPDKDHTNPLSYRSIALTSCLCKIREHMINTQLILYLEKSGILDRSQRGFRKHRSTMDYPMSLERYVWDSFAWRQQAVGLFFDPEKAYYETAW